MPKDCYFGVYAHITVPSKNYSGTLMSADTLIGDPLTLDFRTCDGVSQIWVSNRFGGELGYLDPAVSRRISMYSVRNWSINVVLSLVAYSEDSDGGHYWGEAAVMCYDPKYSDSFVLFTKKVVERLQDGTRPDVALSEQEATNLVKSNGEWFPKKTMSLPTSGTVVMKSRLSISEKMIEQGRARNPGCYVLNFIFIIAFIAVVALIVVKCSM